MLVVGDQLAAPAANINIEGADATYATASAPARYGNYTQIKLGLLAA
jgi:hypothetical protein